MTTPAREPAAAPTCRRRRLVLWLVTLVAVLAVAAGGVLWFAPSRYLPWDTTSFPEVDVTALSPTQAQIVQLLETAHTDQHAGTYYSGGIDEPWCADFVSWIMRGAGHPLTNPNSGDWRIPGVYTLQEYYESKGLFTPVGRGYRPVVGDVVLYDRGDWIGQHTNIVVAVHGDTATTVGGNEAGRIRVHTVTWDRDDGVVGFGRLGN
ncbi:CHAP domain-containing protein [Speluncibacter jeojiensis]|uniref:CHAP domain-containing protein n=1 Tax=Speluncibacter jeojiensis TaxID=2710754 RepID=UPI0038CD696C